MVRLLLLVEGETEETFVKRVLAEHLEPFGVYPSVTILWTKRRPAGGGFRGGVRSYRQIKRDVQRLLNDTSAWVTTLLDFYGLPGDFPGRPQMDATTDPRSRAESLQEALSKDLGDPRRFVPFLAVHEIEAWLFSAPSVVAEHFGCPKLAEPMQRVLADFDGEPERINDGPATHPSRRLMGIIGAFSPGGYHKVSDGPTILQKIGIESVRERCPHFDSWLSRLEQLPHA